MHLCYALPALVGINIKLLYACSICVLHPFPSFCSTSICCITAPNDSLLMSFYKLPFFLTTYSTTTTALTMAFHYCFFLITLLHLSFFSISSQAHISNNQSHFFTLIKKSLSGGSLSQWNTVTGGESSYCNYDGISCDQRGYVVKIDLSAWSLTGRFPDSVCSYLPELRTLRLGHNRLQGNFPVGIINCSFLEDLNLTSSYVTGSLPNLSSLKSLGTLDLSYNLFTGDFPISISNLTNLQVLNFNENGGFNLWKLPEEISRLSKLKRLILSTTMLHGEIPRSIGNMTSLVDLELQGNFLVGRIPKEIGMLRNLKQLELYYNQHLTGEIPDELGNLTMLTDVDMSVNRLTGQIPESLCKLPKLRVLQLYNNSLSGEIPSILGYSKTLQILSVYSNFFTGNVPKNLGESSEMIGVDLSENRLTGELPKDICKGGKLLYFCVLQNLFSGELPESYGSCKSLLRFRVSYNRLQGSIPVGLFALPHVYIIDLGYNHIDGPIPRTIGEAKNLSELLVQSNKISGVVPPEISGASNLVKIDLSNNFLSGPIPPQVGNLRKLNLLLLQDNKLNSSIPNSLSSIKSLNLLDLSNNLLTGEIPESICQLLPNSVNLSNNRLSGSIPRSLIEGGLTESLSGNPGLCVSSYHLNLTKSYFPVCSKVCHRKKINIIWLIGASGIVVTVGLVLFLKRLFSRERSSAKDDETVVFSASFFKDIKCFHKISFDQREILSSLVDKNIVGHGGSGTVYKIQLSSGQAVAVKKLWTRNTKDHVTEFLDKELKTEVQTLGSIRHKNIVKLYAYYSSWDLNLLVYEYMPNGNLWDALHRARTLLDWPTRHNIALGIAQGLAYLHHDLPSPILHRDIKSTNILLNTDYQPKVADFGVAKVVLAKGKDSSTTVVAGTYGYLAPEYAYTSKATTKCDVYSFGVVLLELITGKKPVETEFGESKNIIHWVTCKGATKEGINQVFDKQLSGSFKDEMRKVLRIAICCTFENPSLRPTMNEVVQMLTEADPCRFEYSNSSNKNNQLPNDNKIMSLTT